MGNAAQFNPVIGQYVLVIFQVLADYSMLLRLQQGPQFFQHFAA